MCGIAGAYAHKGGGVDRIELLRVRDAMQARGPDGSGAWFSADTRVGLAHRRLAILDLSDAGTQPMSRGALTIVFNGEIYNFRELRSELIGLGHVFSSHSDTEVILAMWQQYGPAMLPRLRGMFAFALWDSESQRLFLARDPLGIKPLYWADNDGTFRFASQVKALLHAPVDKSPEAAGHVGFLLWGSVPEPWTLYRGIQALPAGHWMCIDQRGRSTPFAYVNLVELLGRVHGADMSEEEVLPQIATALRDSVDAHLESDVPVGVFLSAGLDSTMIAALVAERHRPLVTTTLAFDTLRGTPADESQLAATVAGQLGAQHELHWIAREDFVSERARILDSMDQPSIDGVNTWFVARAAARQGLKVALSGLGGDELLASYPSFTDVPRIVARFGTAARIPGLGKAFRIASASLLRRLSSPKYAGLIEYGGSLGDAYLLRRGLYMPWELPSVLDPDMAREGWNRLHTREALAATAAISGPARMAVSALEMSWYMRNQLLRDADWAGMAHSLEIRVPLVDWSLIERAVPLLAAHPMISKSQVARAAAPRLPSALFDRRKTGFSVPVNEWMTGERVRGGMGMRAWAGHVHTQFSQGKLP